MLKSTKFLWFNFETKPNQVKVGKWLNVLELFSASNDTFITFLKYFTSLDVFLKSNSAFSPEKCDNFQFLFLSLQKLKEKDVKNKVRNNEWGAGPGGKGCDYSPQFFLFPGYGTVQIKYLCEWSILTLVPFIPWNSCLLWHMLRKINNGTFKCILGTNQHL